MDPEHSHHSAPASTAQVIDSVCGMTVDAEQPRGGHHHYRGTTYSFCNPRCLAKFQAEPERYLAPPAAHTPARSAPPAADPADASTIYTCPMHPEVRQVGPGACPKCGMALEPEEPSAEDADSPELIAMTRRLLLSVALAVPLLLLAMSDVLPGMPVQRALGTKPLGWIQLVLATPIVLWGGWPFFVRGAQSLKNHHLNMFTLIALGTGAAYLFSLIAQLAPHLLPAAFSGHGAAPPLYFESAGVIVTLVLLGQVLELRARQATSGALRALLGLAPKTARRLTAAGAEEEVLLAHIQVGDCLRVRPGEKLPVDGEVMAGENAVDDPSNPGGPEGAEPPLAAPAAEPPLHHAHPGHAAPASPALAPPAQTAEQYTCPMHPEVVQALPGRCPKCGMTLVPRKAGPVPAPTPTQRPPGHGSHGDPAGGTS